MSDAKHEVIDDVLLDRLVDGELSPAEYRRVLLALEQQPASWRKCAEAFLQAQAWKREMQDVRAAAEIKPVLDSKPEPPRVNITAGWLKMFLVAAASFALAFTVARQSWRAVERNRPANNVPIASGPVTPQVPQIATTAVHNQPLGKVQLAVNRTGGEPQVMEVPVFDPETATKIISDSRPALPDDLLEALTAEGHRIERQPRLVPIELDDGRQMMVPVEGYRIVPVNRPTY